jgi:hypothetical protein
VVVLVSVAIAVCAYLQALHYPFVSDDLTYIPENTKLLELQIAELWRLFVEPYNCCNEFLPLRDFSYWIDMTLFGQNPEASRLNNIVLYLLCLPLIYATTLGLWRYFRPTDVAGAPWAAMAVTALFSLHPALVESVVWISGRKYILPNLFAMLSLWLAVSAKRDLGLSVPHAFASLLAFVALMFSKSSYVSVAPVIAMLWVLFWLDIPAQSRRRYLLLWPLAILILAGLLTMNFIAKNNGFDGMPFYFVSEAVTRTLAVLGWMARLSVTPESRHFFYPVFEDPYLPAMAALGAVVLSAGVAGMVMLLPRRSLEGFALAAFLLLCMPYIQLIPNHPPSLVADRYLALAVWPVVLLIVGLSWRLKPIPRMALLLAIALPWGFQTTERPRDWQSWDSLLDADLRAYPGFYGPAVYKINNQQIGPVESYNEVYKIASNIKDPDVSNIMIKLIQSDYAVRIDAASTGNPREAMMRLWNAEVDLLQPPAQAKWNSPRYKLWKALQIMLQTQWIYLAEQFPEDWSVRYNAEMWKINVANLEPDFRAYCTFSEVYKQSGRFEDATRAEAECRKLPPS